MDDQRSRKPNFRLPSSSLIENHGRVRGRTQLRHQHLASYTTTSSPPNPASMDGPGPSCSSSSAGGVNKIWSNVRRSISHSGGGKRTMNGMAAVGMHSTPEESLPPPSSPYSYHESPPTSPTIEQIAMGLHISRTPHLGSSSRTYYAGSRHSDTPETPRGVSAPSRPSRPLHVRRGSAPAVSLPPPPTRSSLKKPSTPSSSVSNPGPLTPSDSNASLSTLTSTAPSTPRSNRSASTSISRSVFSSKLHLGMRLLLPSRKNSASSVTTMSDGSASSGLTPRKAVRFSVMSGESEEGS